MSKKSAQFQATCEKIVQASAEPQRVIIFPKVPYIGRNKLLRENTTIPNKQACV